MMRNMPLTMQVYLIGCIINFVLAFISIYLGEGNSMCYTICALIYLTMFKIDEIKTRLP